MDTGTPRCPTSCPAPSPGRDEVGVPSAAASSRHPRPVTTRDLLLRTAERLYAERGIGEVSNRQVAEAAGQANTSAVAYHVGTKTDLVAAIVASHSEAMAGRMQTMTDAARGSTSVRHHVECLVRPYTDHLARLGTPSYWARVTAQIIADPALQEILDADPHLTPLIDRILPAMRALARPCPDDVATIRDEMTRLMVIHSCAEQERSSARTGVPTDWPLVADTLVDGLTAILAGPPDLAGRPTSREHPTEREREHATHSDPVS